MNAGGVDSREVWIRDCFKGTQDLTSGWLENKIPVAEWARWFVVGTVYTDHCSRVAALLSQVRSNQGMGVQG